MDNETLLTEILQNFFDGNLREQRFKVHLQTVANDENVIIALQDVVFNDFFLQPENGPNNFVCINPDYIEFDNYFIMKSACVFAKTKKIEVEYRENGEIKVINGFCRIVFAIDSKIQDNFYWFKYKGRTITTGIYLIEEDCQDVDAKSIPQRDSDGRIVLTFPGGLTKSVK